MNITVFGATGHIGTRVVTRLLSQGHHVKAFIHGQNPLPAHELLTIIQGDVYNQAAVATAIAGSDLVISTLGSWGTPKKDVLTAAMRNIIPASPERIISLTGNAVVNAGEKVHLRDRLNRLLLTIIDQKVLQDGQNHLNILKESPLEWTVIRSPIMKTAKAKGYTFSNKSPAPWKRIARDDVADAIVSLVSSNEYVRQAPFLS